MSEERSHFLMLPYLIDDLGLDVYEYRVYGAIKRAAGEDGQCTKSLDKIALNIKISRSKLKYVINSLCEIHPMIGKPLLIKKNRVSDHGDKDTNIIVVNDVWNENTKVFKKQSGRSCGDPPRSCGDRGVGHVVTEGRSHGDHKEEPFKNIPIKKTTTPTSSSPVDKSSLSFSNEKEKQAEKEAAHSFKDWVDNQALIERERRIGKRGTRIHIEKVQWGKSWMIPLMVYEKLFHHYGISYVQDQIGEMIRQQNELDEGKGKGIDKPETWLKMACEKNYAGSDTKKGE